MVGGGGAQTASGCYDGDELNALAADSHRLHVVHVVRCGFAGGGMENGVINVTNGLPPEKYRVSICALDSSETFSDRIRLPGFESHLLPKRGERIDWPLIFRLARQLRKMDADVVHSHNWGSFIYAVLAAKLARVPVIHGEHGKNPSEVGGDGALKSWMKRTLGHRVRRVVTVSQAIAAEWEALGISRSRIRSIPNGVDVERFRPRSDAAVQRRRFGLPEDGILIGSVGRLDTLKNYSIAIKALTLTRMERICRLVLLGEGLEAENLALQARELGISDRVFLLGRRPDPEHFLAALDIFVLPSKIEGMSNVVLEAMASGLPVVCADLPSHREVLEDGVEGILVSPCTAENLAQVLSELAADPSRRKELGAAARKKIVSDFSLARMVASYENLYAEFAAAADNGMPPKD